MVKSTHCYSNIIHMKDYLQRALVEFFADAQQRGIEFAGQVDPVASTTAGLKGMNSNVDIRGKRCISSIVFDDLSVGRVLVLVPRGY
jgi:hypothetical protein